jgi:hypothetical protein
MPWPGLGNFLIGRQRPQPENPYTTYARKHSLENQARHARGMQRIPVVGYEEWAHYNQQAIEDWLQRIVERYNKDHGTSFHNWDDYKHAEIESGRRDQRIRENMRRARTRGGQPYQFSTGSRPRQQRNRFSEASEEWYARAIDPEGIRREMSYNLERDLASDGTGDLGRTR